MTEEWTDFVANWKGEMAFVAQNAAGGTVQMGT